jgi:hypothetical protein
MFNAASFCDNGYTLSRKTGLRAVGASKGPRLYDFRHRFAVQTLIRWYQTNREPGREFLRFPCMACAVRSERWLNGLKCLLV